MRVKPYGSQVCRPDAALLQGIGDVPKGHPVFGGLVKIDEFGREDLFEGQSRAENERLGSGQGGYAE